MQRKHLWKGSGPDGGYLFSLTFFQNLFRFYIIPIWLKTKLKRKRDNCRDKLKLKYDTVSYANTSKQK